MDNLQKLTTDELTAFYRCLVFYYITTPETQPDGGWYGSYWNDRINDEGPNHDKNTGKTNMTAIRNEIFPFDSNMTKSLPSSCPGYNKVRGKCPGHSKFFGNRIFHEMAQTSLRRGMRNSEQVLVENPPWSTEGKVNERYGVGGFPSNSYVECLQYPQEHGLGGWPSGCDAIASKCDIEEKFENARYQPDGKNRQAGGDPFCGLKPQWFYFAQGLGQFWNMGETSHCYNYIDLFLNAPMGLGKNSVKGVSKPIGWSNGFSPCSDKLAFPPGGGTLGYDISNPSVPTEHNYRDPSYSMKLILEYLSRTDIPGGCRNGNTCQNGLKDPRTGMLGIGFCATGKDGKCPCSEKTENEYVSCLNKKENDQGTDGGCKPNQPVTSRSDALHEQVAALMGLKEGTYWKPYASSGGYTFKSTRDLNGTIGEYGELNDHGGMDPNPAWGKVRVKNCPKKCISRTVI